MQSTQKTGIFCCLPVRKKHFLSRVKLIEKTNLGFEFHSLQEQLLNVTYKIACGTLQNERKRCNYNYTPIHRARREKRAQRLHAQCTTAKSTFNHHTMCTATRLDEESLLTYFLILNTKMERSIRPPLSPIDLRTSSRVFFCSPHFYFAVKQVGIIQREYSFR